MKLADLLEVGEQQLPVVEHGLGRAGLVHGPHVLRDHLHHVAPELLLRFYQLTHHRPARYNRFNEPLLGEDFLCDHSPPETISNIKILCRLKSVSYHNSFDIVANAPGMASACGSCEWLPFQHLGSLDCICLTRCSTNRTEGLSILKIHGFGDF